jgi:hypothetical protein
MTTNAIPTTGTNGISYGFQMSRTDFFKSVLQGSHTKAQELAEKAHINRTFGNVDRQIVDQAKASHEQLTRLSGGSTKIEGTSFGKTGVTTAFAQFGPAAMGIRA